MTILQGKNYYADDAAALEALAHGTLFNVFDASSGYKADLIIRKDRAYSIEEFKRRQSLSREIVHLPKSVDDFDRDGLALMLRELWGAHPWVMKYGEQLITLTWEGVEELRRLGIAG